MANSNESTNWPRILAAVGISAGSLALGGTLLRKWLNKPKKTECVLVVADFHVLQHHCVASRAFPTETIEPSSYATSLFCVSVVDSATAHLFVLVLVRCCAWIQGVQGGAEEQWLPCEPLGIDIDADAEPQVDHLLFLCSLFIVLYSHPPEEGR